MFGIDVSTLKSKEDDMGPLGKVFCSACSLCFASFAQAQIPQAVLSEDYEVTSRDMERKAERLSRTPHVRDRQKIGDLSYADTAAGEIHFDREQLESMFFSLSFLGSGGGIGFIDGANILNHVSLEGLTVQSIDSVDPNKIYVVAGGIGAPAAIRDDLENIIKSIAVSAQTLASVKGKELGGILSVESGSVNSVIAMVVSQELGVPLIDVDGAGRAVPSLTNLTYAHEAYPISPVILTNPATQTPTTLNLTDASDAEGQIRDLISSPGWSEVGGLALWSQTGAELQASQVIQDVFLRAYNLGRYVVNAWDSNGILTLRDYLKAQGELFFANNYVLENFEVVTAKGFDTDQLTLTAANDQQLVILALNEDLLFGDESAPAPMYTAPV